MTQHLTKLLLAIACLLMYSCKDDQVQDQEPVEQIVQNDSKMVDLQVPDKFDYSTSIDISLSIHTIDSVGETAPNTLVYVIGLTDEGASGQIFSGMTDAEGKMSVDLNIPSHFEEGLVRTEYGYSSLAHPVRFSAFMDENLTVNGSAILQSLDSRGQNCFPSISGLFSSDGKRVGVSSSQGIESATLFFTNGSPQQFNNSTNQVFFTSDREICNNGIDDDGDGFVDCADPECGIESGNCSGTIPCVSSFFQIIGRSLRQLDPITGSYTTIGTMPAGYTYNGGGYNEEDGYIYCTAKDNQTKKVYLGRIYGNGNITILDEIENFEGRSYTGDMDGQGNLTNFYYKESSSNGNSSNSGNSGGAVTSSNIDCNAAGNVTVGNDQINLAGTEYNAGLNQTTFYYCVTSGNAPNISHVLFTCGGCNQGDLPNCSNTPGCSSDLFAGSTVVDKGTWSGSTSNGISKSSGAGSPEQGCDGSTGICGLKFDEGINAGNTQKYYFTLSGNWSTGTISFISKAGPGYDFALIPGPACSDCGSSSSSSNDSGWYMSKLDVSSSNPQLSITQGAASSLAGENFHDWVYNANCDKFYALTAGGKKLLVANHKSASPTVESIASYNGLPSGAYGAAWADDEGDLYFSNNGTGRIYKVTMNNGCNPTGIAFHFQGASNSNNDGMSCPSAVVADFGGYDTDDDGIPDSNELEAFTNPLDACNPLNSSAACDGSVNYGFVCSASGNGNKTIAYVKCNFNCDAPDQYAHIYNNSVDNDVDNDNVPNATDPNPTERNEAFVQYRPSQNSFGTYAFEDLWPETGDYDFNDMVVQVQERIITNNTSKVYKVIYDIKIMAMGGIFNNNLGIVTPDPGNKASIKVISAHNVNWSSTQIGNDEVIIIEKPKQMFYSLGIVNAWNSDPYFQPLEFQVEVQLEGRYSYPSGYDSKIFIEQNAADGHEIHIAGKAPTQNMTAGLLGTEKDDSNPSTSKYFLTENNLPWGIYIPTEWKYPQEGIDLTSAYIRFAEYAQSNPSLDWYTNTSANVVSSRVYNKH